MQNRSQVQPNPYIYIIIHTLFLQRPLVASVWLLEIWLLVKIRVALPSWTHSTVVVVWFCWLFWHQWQRMSSRRPREFLVYWHARVRWYWVPVAATQTLSGARRMVWLYMSCMAIGICIAIGTCIPKTMQMA